MSYSERLNERIKQEKTNKAIQEKRLTRKQKKAAKINKTLKKDNSKALNTTSTYQDKTFYRSSAWLKLRYAVLIKYGRKCMLCHETEGQMHVDHIIPKSRAPQLALAMSNLQILCRACNIGKGDSCDKDFRPKEQI